MYWLPRRKDFKLSEWRAKCKCKHAHDEHLPNVPKKCKKCGCFDFYSDFACISCDGRWEDHVTLYEFEHDRIQAGKKVGYDFEPLSMNTELHGLMFDPNQRKMLPNNNRPAPKKKSITNNSKKPISNQVGFGNNKGMASKYDDYGGFGDNHDGFKNDGSYKPLVPMMGYQQSGLGPKPPQQFKDGNDAPFPGAKKKYNQFY